MARKNIWRKGECQNGAEEVTDQKDGTRAHCESASSDNILASRHAFGYLCLGLNTPSQIIRHPLQCEWHAVPDRQVDSREEADQEREVDNWGSGLQSIARPAVAQGGDYGDGVDYGGVCIYFGHGIPRASFISGHSSPKYRAGWLAVLWEEGGGGAHRPRDFRKRFMYVPMFSLQMKKLSFCQRTRSTLFGYTVVRRTRSRQCKSRSATSEEHASGRLLSQALRVACPHASSCLKRELSPQRSTSARECCSEDLAAHNILCLHTVSKGPAHRTVLAVECCWQT